VEEFSAASFLNRVLLDAIERQASDVHVQVFQNRLNVSFRCRGVIVPYLHESSDVGHAFVRRMKALAGLDVSDPRVPQDGSFSWHDNAAAVCDIRIATMPTVYGEAVVLRLLHPENQAVGLDKIGLTDAQVVRVRKWLRSFSGLILVAGTTGAGKTTTLYAMMRELAEMGRHVVSIEDPVETRIDTCHQMEVHPQYGVTFEVGLRSILRHDPDVIMIGEIRDIESARTALRASLTGRLVLATTHARDTVGAALRLIEFGQPRSLVAEALSAVLLQSLCAIPCEHCIGPSCESCTGTGVLSTRRATFELDELTLPFRHQFASSNCTYEQLRMTTSTQSATGTCRESAGAQS